MLLKLLSFVNLCVFVASSPISVANIVVGVAGLNSGNDPSLVRVRTGLGSLLRRGELGETVEYLDDEWDLEDCEFEDDELI
jgi:hypothetical protein